MRDRRELTVKRWVINDDGDGVIIFSVPVKRVFDVNRNIIGDSSVNIAPTIESLFSGAVRPAGIISSDQ